MKQILQRLKETAERYPEKTSFADANSTLSFAQLYSLCLLTGRFLQKKGLAREPVLICMKKAPEFAAALFGVLAGACAYVPLDEGVPEKRLHDVIRDTNARLLICDKETQARALAAAKGTDCDVLLFDEVSRTKGENETRAGMGNDDADVVPVAVREEDLAYIMYTSGSTGRPKGVMVTHANLDAYVTRLIDFMGFSADCIFANQTPFSTDASVKELYTTVFTGATTWILPRMLFSFPVKLIAFLNEHRVNTICWAASAYVTAAAYEALTFEKPIYLQKASFGSEALPAACLDAWMTACPKTRFTNLYGPTEATGVCCGYHVPEGVRFETDIPAGKPFPDADILIADEAGGACKINETGEIWIGGPQVSAGYLGDAALTAEKFVLCADGKKRYKSGDRGYFDTEHLLHYAGRIDLQIKHMGYRIEPAEIEAVCMEQEGMVRCACVYDEAERRLLLFYEGTVCEQDLQRALKQALPRHMVPAAVRKMERIPLNANGKTDRALLAQSQGNR